MTRELEIRPTESLQTTQAINIFTRPDYDVNCYEQFFEIPEKDKAELGEKFLELIPIKENANILFHGIGTGRLELPIIKMMIAKKQHVNIYAVDSSYRMLEKLLEKINEPFRSRMVESNEEIWKYAHDNVSLTVFHEDLEKFYTETKYKEVRAVKFDVIFDFFALNATIVNVEDVLIKILPFLKPGTHVVFGEESGDYCWLSNDLSKSKGKIPKPSLKNYRRCYFEFWREYHRLRKENGREWVSTLCPSNLGKLKEIFNLATYSGICRRPKLDKSKNTGSVRIEWKPRNISLATCLDIVKQDKKVFGFSMNLDHETAEEIATELKAKEYNLNATVERQEAEDFYIYQIQDIEKMLGLVKSVALGEIEVSARKSFHIQPPLLFKEKEEQKKSPKNQAFNLLIKMFEHEYFDKQFSLLINLGLKFHEGSIDPQNVEWEEQFPSILNLRMQTKSYEEIKSHALHFLATDMLYLTLFRDSLPFTELMFKIFPTKFPVHIELEEIEQPEIDYDLNTRGKPQYMMLTLPDFRKQFMQDQEIRVKLLSLIDDVKDTLIPISKGFTLPYFCDLAQIEEVFLKSFSKELDLEGRLKEVRSLIQAKYSEKWEGYVNRIMQVLYEVAVSSDWLELFENEKEKTRTILTNFIFIYVLGFGDSYSWNNVTYYPTVFGEKDNKEASSLGICAYSYLTEEEKQKLKNSLRTENRINERLALAGLADGTLQYAKSAVEMAKDAQWKNLFRKLWHNTQFHISGAMDLASKLENRLKELAPSESFPKLTEYLHDLRYILELSRYVDNPQDYVIARDTAQRIRWPKETNIGKIVQEIIVFIKTDIQKDEGRVLRIETDDFYNALYQGVQQNTLFELCIDDSICITSYPEVVAMIIKDIVVNATSNAIDFNALQKGSLPKVTVKVAKEPIGKGAILIVRNESGISSEAFSIWKEGKILDASKLHNPLGILICRNYLNWLGYRFDIPEACVKENGGKFTEVSIHFLDEPLEFIKWKEQENVSKGAHIIG